MKRIAIGAGVGLIAIAVTAVAGQEGGRMTGSTKEAFAIAKDSGMGYLRSKTNGWLSRTDIDYDLRQGAKPVGSIETIQPLYMDARNTLFWQGRAAYADVATTLNLGLGYRFLNMRKTWMLGVNGFYDYEARHLHRRIGVGGEFFTPYVTFRANYYNAISHQRQIAVASYARARGGYDVSLETPVPYTPWMRLSAQGYHWAGEDRPSRDGLSVGVRSFPYDQLEVDAGVAYDQVKHGQGYLSANYYLAKPAFIEHSEQSSRHMSHERFAKQNLENMRLQKVIRHNDIEVEKTSSPGVSFGRGA